ncbi:MAG TPA: cytochrome c [Acidobacteriaceae bacterium]
MTVGCGSVRSAVGRALLVGAAVCLVVASCSFSPTPTAHAASKAVRKQGAAVFHEKGCEHCHGVDGVGTDKGPDLSGVGRQLHKPEIAKQIHDGGKQMPAFGDALTDDEIQQLVEYLAAKKEKVRKPAPVIARLKS